MYVGLHVCDIWCVHVYVYVYVHECVQVWICYVYVCAYICIYVYEFYLLTSIWELKCLPGDILCLSWLYMYESMWEINQPRWLSGLMRCRVHSL